MGAQGARLVRRVALLLLGGLSLGLLFLVLTCTAAEADSGNGNGNPDAPSGTSLHDEPAEAAAPPSGTTGVVPASSDSSGPLSTGTSSNNSAADADQVPEAAAPAGPSADVVTPVVAPVADLLADITAVALPATGGAPAQPRNVLVGSRQPVARPVVGGPNGEAAAMHRHHPASAEIPVTTVPHPVHTVLSQVTTTLHATLDVVPIVGGALQELTTTVDVAVAGTLDVVDATTAGAARLLRTVSLTRPLAALGLAPITVPVDNLLGNTATTVDTSQPTTVPAATPGPNVSTPADPTWPTSTSSWTDQLVAVTSPSSTGPVADAALRLPPSAVEPTLLDTTAIAPTGVRAFAVSGSTSELPVPVPGGDQSVAPAGLAAGGAGSGSGTGGAPVASLIATLDLPAHLGGSRMMPGAWALPGAPSYDPGHSPD